MDVAIQYDCPYSGQAYILVLRNASHVPAMKNRLIPSFVLREAGLRVSDTPKIYSDDPDILDHSIYFKEANIHIPLFLNGIFSYFPMTKPTLQILAECEDIFILTPDR